MKKLVLLVASAVAVMFSISAFALTAYAEVEYQDFFEYLIEETDKYEEEVDISEYVRENDWSMNDIKYRLKYFYLSEPELFFVNREVGVKYNDDLSEVSLLFEYIYPQDEVKTMKKKMKKAALKATEGITEDMTDVEKALVVHDYLIINTNYDHKEENFSAYNCLVEKSCVCQGYSLAYLYVMRDILGIPCSVIFTDSQNHSWNYIQIDDDWYHVDLTSDDPTFTTYAGTKYDARGEVIHDNFMKSDEAFYKSSPLHRKWNTMGRPLAGNDKYDDYFWNDTTSAAFKIGDLWYYSSLDKSSPGANYESGGATNIYTNICTYNFETGEKNIIKILDSSWTVYRNPSTGKKINGESWYKKSYTKLVAIDGMLYFNSPQYIYRLDPNTGVIKRVYSLRRNNKQIFTIVPEGNKNIMLVYKNDLSYENKYIRIKIS